MTSFPEQPHFHMCISPGPLPSRSPQYSRFHWIWQECSCSWCHDGRWPVSSASLESRCGGAPGPMQLTLPVRSPHRLSRAHSGARSQTGTLWGGIVWSATSVSRPCLIWCPLLGSSVCSRWAGALGCRSQSPSSTTSHHCCGRSWRHSHRHAIFHGTPGHISLLPPTLSTQSTGRKEETTGSISTDSSPLPFWAANYITNTLLWTQLHHTKPHMLTSLAIVLFCKKGFPPPLPELIVTSKSPSISMDNPPRPIEDSVDADLFRCLYSISTTPITAKGINITSKMEIHAAIVSATYFWISESGVLGTTTEGVGTNQPCEWDNTRHTREMQQTHTQDFSKGFLKL